MTVLLTGRSNSYVQFITVLLVFVLVLAATAFTSKWLANYQKGLGGNCNVEVIETSRIGNNKYIQIVRIGQTYMAIAVCKDTVTTLCEIPKEQLAEVSGFGGNMSFKELFDKVIKKDSSDMNEPKE